MSTTAVNLQLAIYTGDMRALEEFKTIHAETFAQYERMCQIVNNAEAELRAACREFGPCENDTYTVTVQTKTRKWFDADKVLELAPYVAEMPGVMEVNRERINQLAKAKAISVEVLEAAYREEALTPAVTIKRKENGA